MGRYAAQGDIVPSLMAELLVAQITRNDSTATTVETTVLATHIAEAEAEVEAYIGRRFSLPLSGVPVLLTRLSARITRYRLYTSRPGEVEAWVQKDYDSAVALLEKLRDGLVDLGLTSAGADPAASPNTDLQVRTGSVEPVYGRTNLKDY